MLVTLNWTTFWPWAWTRPSYQAITQLLVLRLLC